ncbi:MAG TPA: SRPBCC domain-containing protein [Chryseolinea sp.]|nr:SRPBCC domain-containing protein [Chryseolinea sp.]
MNTDMKEIEFKAEILAPKTKVWDTMLNQDTYKEWTGVSWPGSSYEGQWKKGSDIRFIGPDSSGTLATITDLEPYRRVVAKHVAILLKGGGEDRTSEGAKGWVGTSESYYFDESNGRTTLKVNMRIAKEWEQMMKDGWPLALGKLKEIVEKQSTVSASEN